MAAQYWAIVANNGAVGTVRASRASTPTEAVKVWLADILPPTIEPPALITKSGVQDMHGDYINWVVQWEDCPAVPGRWFRVSLG